MMQKVDHTPSFDRTWDEFKAGFGDISGDYWLGNDQIHQLTKDDDYKLRVDIVATDSGRTQEYPYWAEYSTFTVGDEKSHYQLRIKRYTAGNAGDILGAFNEMPFSIPIPVTTMPYGYSNARVTIMPYGYNNALPLQQSPTVTTVPPRL